MKKIMRRGVGWHESRGHACIGPRARLTRLKASVRSSSVGSISRPLVTRTSNRLAPDVERWDIQPERIAPYNCHHSQKMENKPLMILIGHYLKRQAHGQFARIDLFCRPER